MPAPIPIERLTYEQQKLIEDNINFIYWCFDKYGVLDEDWQQDCFYAICKFIHLYDPEKGNITTFLRTIIEKRRATIYRRENNRRESFNSYALRLEDMVVDNDGDKLKWSDIVGEDDDGFEKIEDREFYLKFIDDLCNDEKITKKQFNYFVAYLSLGNYGQAGKLYGTSRQAVQQAVNTIRKKIKRENKYHAILKEK